MPIGRPLPKRWVRSTSRSHRNSLRANTSWAAPLWATYSQIGCQWWIADLPAHDHENLFIPGGGAMPSTASGNSTITMTALAFKAADAITSQIRGG